MAKKYELASAYVSIMPSLEGVSDKIGEQIQKATPNMQKRMSAAMSKAGQMGSTAFSKTFGQGGFVRRFGSMIGNAGTSAFKNVGSSAGSLILNGISSVGRRLGQILLSGARSGITRIGETLKNSISGAAKVGATAIGTALGAIGGQTFAGGLSRALSMNAATSKLKAFGYEAAEIEKIISSVQSVVKNTRFTTPEALNTTTQLLASGIKPGKELEKILNNTKKLADMGGTSFEEFGNIISKAYAGGKIQAEDLNIISEKGIGIRDYLAQQMGKTVEEVMEAASAGEISFEHLMDAVEAVNFDSAVLAANDAKLAFANVRSNLSAIGEKFWNPIVDRSAEFFNNIRAGLISLQNNESFMTFMKRLNIGTEKIVEKFIKMSEKFAAFMETDKIAPFLSKLTDFRESIKGIEGPVIGLGLAIGSTLLGQLPIVGGLLGGLSAPAGILLGVIAMLTMKFSEFGNFAKAAMESVSTFFEGFVEGISGDSKLLSDRGEDNPIQKFFKKMTDLVSNYDFSALGKNVGEDLSGIFSSLITEVPRIISALTDLFQKITAGLTVFTSGTDAGNLVESLSNIIIGIINTISGLLPAITVLATSIGKAITSDTATKVFGGIIKFFSFVVENEAVMLTAIGILATLFIGGKLVKIITFFTHNSAFGKGLEKFAKSLERGMVAFIKMLSSVATAAAAALPQLAIITALVIAIAAIIKLLDSIGVFEVLEKIIRFIIDILLDAIVRLAPVFADILEAVGGFLTTLSDIFVQALPVVSDSITKIIDAIAGGIETIFTSVIDFITVLADKGKAAGEGGKAFAEALGSIATGLLKFTGGSLLSQAGDGISSLFGGNGSVDQILQMAEAFGTLGESIKVIPEALSSILPHAEQVGMQVGTSFVMSMMMGITATRPALSASMQSLLSSLQAQLNANPLKIRVEQPSIARVNATSGRGSVASQTNITNTFNVRNVRDNGQLDRLIRAAR